MLLLNLLDLRLRVTLPGLPRWVTWLVGKVVVRLVLGLQSRVLLDVVGVVFVGLGGETVGSSLRRS